MGRFLAAYAGGGELDGERILSEETVAEMFTVQLPDVESTQGVFWYWSDHLGPEMIGHNGGDYGTATDLYFDVDSGVGIVVMANVDWRRASSRAIGLIEDELLAVGMGL